MYYVGSPRDRGASSYLSDRQSQHALPIGYQLHWFQIESILGLGGFGITYLARDGNLKRSVAIKEFMPLDVAVRRDNGEVHPQSGARNESRFGLGLSRFLTESRALARVEDATLASGS